MKFAVVIYCIVAIVLIIVAVNASGQENMRSKVLPWFGPAKSVIPSIVDNNTIYDRNARSCSLCRG